MKTLKNLVLERLKLNKDTKINDNLYLVRNMENQSFEDYATEKDLINAVVKNWDFYSHEFEHNGRKIKPNVTFHKFDNIENKNKYIELVNNKEYWDISDLICNHTKAKTIDKTGKIISESSF